MEQNILVDVVLHGLIVHSVEILQGNTHRVLQTMLLSYIPITERLCCPVSVFMKGISPSPQAESCSTSASVSLPGQEGRVDF